MKSNMENNGALSGIVRLNVEDDFRSQMRSLPEIKSTFDLEKIKIKIENMSKHHQIEILKIFKKYSNVKLNENKSGVFINLSFLSNTTIEELVKYIHFVEAQEDSIRQLENQCEEYKNNFFT